MTLDALSLGSMVYEIPMAGEAAGPIPGCNRERRVEMATRAGTPQVGLYRMGPLIGDLVAGRAVHGFRRLVVLLMAVVAACDLGCLCRVRRMTLSAVRILVIPVDEGHVPKHRVTGGEVHGPPLRQHHLGVQDRRGVARRTILGHRGLMMAAATVRQALQGNGAVLVRGVVAAHTVDVAVVSMAEDHIPGREEGTP